MESAARISARSLQYYVVGTHWASDLEFFRIETLFLHRLLDDYFVRLLGGGHLKELSRTGNKLLTLEKNEVSVSKSLTEQLKQLELMAEDIIPEDTEELAGRQAKLENEVANITNQYREIKKELFELVENAMHGRKLIAG